MNKNKVLLVAALIITPLVFSSGPIVMKILLRELPPFTLGFVRFSIASLLITPFWITEKRAHHRFNPLLLLVLLTGAFNITLFVIGINKTIPNAAQILYTSTPLIVGLIAHFMLNEKITKRKLTGIVIGLLGTLIILILPAIRHNEEIVGNFTGNVIIFIAVWTWAAYTIGSRHLSEKHRYSPLFLLGSSFYTNAIILAILMMIFEHPSISIQTFPIRSIALLGYLCLGPTVITFFFYQWIIKHTSAGIAALTSYIQPPFGFFLAWILLGTSLSWEFIIGTIIICIGVYLATLGKSAIKDLPVTSPQE